MAMDSQHIIGNGAIFIRQNEPLQLQRLAAQRQIYATVKIIFGWQILLGVVLPLIGVVVVAFFPEAKLYVTTWGALFAAVDWFWVTPWQQSLRNSATCIQEAFDCDVLALQWNTIKCGGNPIPEVVAKNAKKYEKWSHKMHPLTNWYPLSISSLPVHIGRIICQRANCWWDAEQRRNYSNWVAAIMVVVLLVAFVSSLKSGFSLTIFIFQVILPLLPFFVIGGRQFREHRSAARRLDELRVHSEALWKKALAGASISDLEAESRVLQDEIFENRKKNPPVLDWLFKRLRNEFEGQMNVASAHFVHEAEAALGLPRRKT